MDPRRFQRCFTRFLLERPWRLLKLPETPWSPGPSSFALSVNFLEALLAPPQISRSKACSRKPSYLIRDLIARVQKWPPFILVKISRVLCLLLAHSQQTPSSISRPTRLMGLRICTRESMRRNVLFGKWTLMTFTLNPTETSLEASLNLLKPPEVPPKHPRTPEASWNSLKQVWNLLKFPCNFRANYVDS